MCSNIKNCKFMFGLKLNKYFHPLEAGGLGSETQLQVGEN